MQMERLLEAINFKGVVSGLTHDFYRYPARLSPCRPGGHRMFHEARRHDLGPVLRRRHQLG